jgi:glycosyltransferase involved in cell wall biosynthesis
MNFGVVAIGRNEGERLKRGLASIPAGMPTVYVDSGSTDGSSQWARGHGAKVIELDMSIPFTAARARNAGFQRLKEIAPGLRFVQFIDGDCELEAKWLESAEKFLASQKNAAAVCGRRRERHPESSIYNWLCDREWDRPAGEVQACGGDAMMRIDALERVHGFRDDLIAGEEPELCFRLRAAGWQIFRLDSPMTVHDAAITRFRQWWLRSQRSGYAFAQGAHIHGASTERYRVWETRRAVIWGTVLPLVCLLVGLAFSPWGWIAWGIYPLQLLRQAVRNQGTLGERLLQALFQILARFAEAWGVIRFRYDRLVGRRSHVIEYK